MLKRHLFLLNTIKKSFFIVEKDYIKGENPNKRLYIRNENLPK
jgi:hypothetical protein